MTGVFGEWTTRAERAAEFDREEQLAARALADLQADQHARTDADGHGS